MILSLVGTIEKHIRSAARDVFVYLRAGNVYIRKYSKTTKLRVFKAYVYSQTPFSYYRFIEYAK